MKRFRFLHAVPLLAVVLGGLASGCDTYHYYDIDVRFATPVTSPVVSVMKLCLVDVSGAASDEVTLDCPPAKFPDLGTFEYSTFADSGQITFTFNGFLDTPKSSNNQCASSSTTLTGSAQITQTGMITVDNFNTTNCPQMISQ